MTTEIFVILIDILRDRKGRRVAVIMRLVAIAHTISNRTFILKPKWRNVKEQREREILI